MPVLLFKLVYKTKYIDIKRIRYAETCISPVRELNTLSVVHFFFFYVIQRWCVFVMFFLLGSASDSFPSSSSLVTAGGADQRNAEPARIFLYGAPAI